MGSRAARICVRHARLRELGADWLHAGSPARMPRSPFPRGAGEDRETGVGQNRGGFAGMGVPSRRPSPPSRPCRGSDTPFCPLRAQAGLGDGARGALAHHGGNITRCSFAPNSPLPSQHIPSALQNGRRPPASPSPSEPGVGSLAPICGSSGRVKSRRFFRALLAAPMLQPAAMLCWSGGRSEGRRWVDLCCALAWWPGAIFRIKWAAPHGRGAVCTPVRVKNGLE